MSGMFFLRHTVDMLMYRSVGLIHGSMHHLCMVRMMTVRMMVKMRSTCCPDGRTNFIIARPWLVSFHQTAVRIWQIVIVTVDHVPCYCATQKQTHHHHHHHHQYFKVAYIIKLLLGPHRCRKKYIVCRLIDNVSHSSHIAIVINAITDIKLTDTESHITETSPRGLSRLTIHSFQN